MSPTSHAPAGPRLRALTRPARLLLAASIAFVAPGVVVCGEAPARGLEPDRRIQAAIEDAATAIAAQDVSAAERVHLLQEIAAGQRETMLLQMALYLEKSDGTERSMAGAILLRQLAFTPPEILDGVVPRLEGARPPLRRIFTDFLGSIDRRDGGEPDFRVYDAWLAGRGDRPPAALVSYLYEVSPAEALDGMRRVYGRGAEPRSESTRAVGELQGLMADRDASRSWSDADRRRAATALESLSRDPSWWVRRYAAEVARVDVGLVPAPLVKRLKEDADPLVRQAFP
ncbi:MAG TPA: hypothetical protein VJV75_13120 [Candidatus Polarisedimenticolia bacterium]|nr:hypothetical protein [Candidatus Polarisedimenticolia bacterium]